MIDIPTLVGALVDGDSTLGKKAQIIAAVGTILLLILVIELVRRRRLVERYALLWMLAAVIMVVLAVWNDALGVVADALGILSPPNALFLLGLAAGLGMLLNFSVAISRLSEETKILAQIAARLDTEVRSLRGSAANGNGDSPAPGPGAEAPSSEPEPSPPEPPRD